MHDMCKQYRHISAYARVMGKCGVVAGMVGSVGVRVVTRFHFHKRRALMEEGERGREGWVREREDTDGQRSLFPKLQ